MMTRFHSAPAVLLVASAFSLGTGCIDTEGLFFPDGPTTGVGGVGGADGVGGSGGSATSGSAGGDAAGGGGMGPEADDFRSEVLADEPIAYWPLDVFDTDARTESAVGNLTANVAANVPSDFDTTIDGRIDGAVRVYANADVGLPAPHALGFGDGSYTLETWVRVGGEGGEVTTCVDQGGMANAGYRVYVGPMGSSHKRYDGLGGNEEEGTSQSDLTGWTHLVVTHDDVENKTRLYINGANFFPGGRDQVFSWQHQARFILARAGFGMTDYVDVDEVAVYDKVLSGERVQRHYACADGCPD